VLGWFLAGVKVVAQLSAVPKSKAIVTASITVNIINTKNRRTCLEINIVVLLQKTVYYSGIFFNEG
jgi:hypothetical protein